MTDKETIAALNERLAENEKFINRLLEEMRDMSRAAIEARDYAYQTIGAVLHWSSAAGANFGESVTDELVGEIRAMRNKPSLFTPIQKGKKKK